MTNQALSRGQRVFTCYRRSPIGLPLPGILAGNPAWDAALNRLLQQLAWDAVTQHPMSGVGANGATGALVSADGGYTCQ